VRIDLLGSRHSCAGYAAGLAPCPFCAMPASDIWIGTEHAVASAASVPLADGHTLVVPRKHVITVHQLPLLEQKAVWALVTEVRGRLLTG
jgi:diadenosine tetraphosphate (Ap4A) HIT family hydrolase